MSECAKFITLSENIVAVYYKIRSVFT